MNTTYIGLFGSLGLVSRAIILEICLDCEVCIFILKLPGGGGASSSSARGGGVKALHILLPFWEP